ncbi:unnamed protein product [Pleuronectes platessa]|uniref:Uncharacterized protein n=1 Tax=Pleuronectes platessa TaxID=8262 RepID=A0A9N7VC78_PLEPL|nr:unnamed protein product [Pleuronectes platessa]
MSSTCSPMKFNHLLTKAATLRAVAPSRRERMMRTRRRGQRQVLRHLTQREGKMWRWKVAETSLICR